MDSASPCPSNVRAGLRDDHHEVVNLLEKTDCKKDEKRESNSKSRKTVEKRNCIEIVRLRVVYIQSAVTYVFIGDRT